MQKLQSVWLTLFWIKSFTWQWIRNICTRCPVLTAPHSWTCRMLKSISPCVTSWCKQTKPHTHAQKSCLSSKNDSIALVSYLFRWDKESWIQSHAGEKPSESMGEGYDGHSRVYRNDSWDHHNDLVLIKSAKSQNFTPSFLAVQCTMKFF